jgi:hypothetical protein
MSVPQDAPIPAQTKFHYLLNSRILTASQIKTAIALFPPSLIEQEPLRVVEPIKSLFDLQGVLHKAVLPTLAVIETSVDTVYGFYLDKPLAEYSKSGEDETNCFLFELGSDSMIYRHSPGVNMR